MISADTGAAIPDLRPQVGRSELEWHLKELRTLVDKQPLSGSDIDKATAPLHNLRFYLNQDQCDEINRLRDVLKAKRSDDSWRDYKPFAPDPEFDSSYLL